MVDLVPIQKAIESLVDFGRYLASIAAGVESVVLRTFAISDTVRIRGDRKKQAVVLSMIYSMVPIRVNIIQSIREFCNSSRWRMEIANMLTGSPFVTMLFISIATSKSCPAEPLAGLCRPSSR